MPSWVTLVIRRCRRLQQVQQDLTELAATNDRNDTKGSDTDRTADAPHNLGKDDLAVPARVIPGFCHGRGRKRRLQEGRNKKGTNISTGRAGVRYICSFVPACALFGHPGTPGTHLLLQMWKMLSQSFCD